jgi:uncharacterized protein involved in cysteine biosynthesis
MASINGTAISRALLTAVKYALWTLAGAVVTYLMNLLPSIQGQYAVWTPIFALILKTLATFIATRSAEIKIMRAQGLIK